MGRKRLLIFGDCLICGKQFEKRKPNGMSYRDKVVCSLSCRGKYVYTFRGTPVRTPEWNKKIGDAQRGTKGNNWKGGLWSSQPRNERKNPKYKKLRDSIFKRDNYTCVLCKAKGELNVDHIKSYSKYPELRYIPSNLRTLCVPCHKKTESYGKG